MQRSNFILKVAMAIILVAIFCYIGFYVIDLLRDPLVTAPAARYTVEDGASVSGWAVREETVLYGSGDIYTETEDGARVGAGQTVAVRYNSDDAMRSAAEIRELRLEIVQLEDLADSGASSGSASEAVTELASAVAHGKTADLDELTLAIQTRLFSSYLDRDIESDLAHLHMQLDSLMASSYGTEDITASVTGVFSSVTDGCESVTPEDVLELVPSRLKALFDTAGGGDSGAYGKVITGSKWYYAAILDDADADMLTVGETARVEFTSTFCPTLDMKVESISESENGKRAVVFSSIRELAGTVTLRELTADIIFDSHTGMLVEGDAVITDDTGTYLYILVGSQAKRVDVEILTEYTGGRLLVQSVNEGELRDGAETVVTASKLYDGKVVR